MTFCQLTLVIAIFAASTSALTLPISTGVIKIKPLAVITEEKFSRIDTIGVVKNVRTCGGSTQLVQWRYATCSKLDKVCRVPADAVLRIAQVDFVPSNDISKPALRFVVKSNDGKVNSTYDEGSLVINSGVKKGVAYTVTVFGGCTDEVKGKDATFNFIIYDLASGAIQLCGETDLKFD